MPTSARSSHRQARAWPCGPRVPLRSVASAVAVVVLLIGASLSAQTADTPTAGAAAGAAAGPALAGADASRAEVLRGTYSRHRANNDVLHYDLAVRVEPDRQYVSGRNRIRFRMLVDDTRIQLDLHDNLAVDGILLDGRRLDFSREAHTVFVDFPRVLRAGETYEIEFRYSGTPLEQGRFGGMAFRRDGAGRHWVTTANEDEGASLWWPCKDQWLDEPDGVDVTIEAPAGLVAVSNGRLIETRQVEGGYRQWHWRVSAPINAYNVSLNLAAYTHIADRRDALTLDYYVLPENADRARAHFAQVSPMLDAFERYVGPFPFPEDGYKLVEVPYAGMEHQSAIAYGNRFANGYLERDWTGVGISPRFDFIIVHESAHEWFGNALTAADVSDMWIHEGWATYLEAVYVEHRFGTDDAFRYVNALKDKVRHDAPILTTRGLHRVPPSDMYFKGALLLHTLRGVVGDDARWWNLVRGVYARFRYQTLLTEDLVGFINGQLGRDLTPLFDQYLRHTALPTLELRFDESAATVSYRWRADVAGFQMPVLVGRREAWTRLEATTEWQTAPNTLAPERFEVATDHFYIDVEKR